MSNPVAHYVKVGALPDVAAFRAALDRLGLNLPCDAQVENGSTSPLGQPVSAGRLRIGNRFAIHPMEGWDGEPDGTPSEHTRRRWRRFGQSGAKLIWGGEAVAVCPSGRANPNQMVLTEATLGAIAALRETVLQAHREATGSTAGLITGLQLTHSGRYCRPTRKDLPEPRIVFRHPILDRRLGLSADYPVLTDGELRALVEDYGRAAELAARAGFDFVDIKHCHGYLGHELLGAHTRPGDYGGPFENRTRFLREVIQVVRSRAPSLEIGVRLSAFDLVPFRPDPERSTPGQPGPGVPETCPTPYLFGFGVNPQDPVQYDLTETLQLCELLQSWGVRLINVTAGSPYYNPHIQRPALYPPSDGYLPPEDPLVGVHRQMEVCRQLKARFPGLIVVGTAYTYLQEFLPHVAQGAVRAGWTDCVGLGRMALSYPELPNDVLSGRGLQKKRLCRTFSDCTTGPRNGLISGCYPLDPYYRDSPLRAQLAAIKQRMRGAGNA